MPTSDVHHHYRHRAGADHLDRATHSHEGGAVAHVHADGWTRWDRGTSASRNENRLTDADRGAIRDAIARALAARVRADGYADLPSIAADFNPTQRAAYRSIGCTGHDLRESEVDEIADMVAAAILDAAAVAA